MPKKPGRKRIYEEPLDSYNMRYHPSQIRKARRIGEDNAALGMRTAIDAYPWPDLETTSLVIAWMVNVIMTFYIPQEFR